MFDQIKSLMSFSGNRQSVVTSHVWEKAHRESRMLPSMTDRELRIRAVNRRANDNIFKRMVLRVFKM